MLSLLTMVRDSDESLAVFVKRVREEKGLSLNDVVRKSGYAISNAYISKIENGESINPTPKKLKALSKGLDLPFKRLQQVAEGIEDDEVDFADSALKLLYEKLRTAAPEDRRFLEASLQVLTEWAARREEARVRG